MIQAVRTSETSVYFNENVRSNIPESGYLQISQVFENRSVFSLYNVLNEMEFRIVNIDHSSWKCFSFCSLLNIKRHLVTVALSSNESMGRLTWLSVVFEKGGKWLRVADLRVHRPWRFSNAATSHFIINTL
jgi:hypothetical protein